MKTTASKTRPINSFGSNEVASLGKQFFFEVVFPLHGSTLVLPVGEKGEGATSYICQPSGYLDPNPSFITATTIYSTIT
jgi:hypothetical protein